MSTDAMVTQAGGSAQPLTGPYTRVEPISRAPDLRAGLQAVLADPLWLLGRQHQVGELSGEDASTPVRVRGKLTLVPVTSLLPGEGGAAVPLGTRETPAEAALEREDPLAGPGALRARADAGLMLMRALVDAGLAEVWEKIQARTDLALVVPEDAPTEVRLLARRSIDGIKAAGANLTSPPEIWRHPKRDQISAIVREWKSAVEARCTAPSALQGSWVDQRQEYGFGLASEPWRAGERPPRLLAADDHPGGTLDWYSVDATKTSPAKTDSADIKAIPTPISFPGSPASRWFEIEDSAVDWCGVEGGPEDPARLMIAEFMTVYGDDWFMVPVRISRGQLARVTSLRVADTFTWKADPATGADAVDPTTLESVPHIAKVDGDKRTFKLFELRDDPASSAPWLYLPAIAGDVQEGDPIEEVRFIRDEAANLGWAVEKVVEGYDGGPRQRAAPRPPAEEPRTDGRWVYTIQTPVPAGWLPLVPVQIGTTSQIRLRRGRLPDWKDDGSDGPRGRIASGKPFYLREEELPPGGLVVTRRWQRTRGPDGKVWLWIGREKRPGSAESGPGLTFDHVHR